LLWLCPDVGGPHRSRRLVVEAGLKDVDICPLIPLIQNAGGVITTWDGEPAEQGGNCVAAATPELHAAAMAVLRG
jgi:fructose-1,6-bisphosphatase/inositol monophosphatase family enzyme